MHLHLTATSERGKPVTKSGNDYVRLIMKDDSQEDRVILQFTNCVGGIHISLKNLDTKKMLYGGYIKPKTAREYISDCNDRKCGKCDYCIKNNIK